MVPRAAMQATKNPGATGPILLAVLALVLAGCTPAGPRALLEGKQLLDAGKLQEAVAKLTLATQVMPTNAPAWNYLGLARHQAGDVPGAEQAYQQALRLDRELFEAHFNLGCLWLDQNKLDSARNEFTACTLRRANSVEAWLRLGSAHTRLGEFPAAEAAFQKSLRLNPNNPEAHNGLGVLSVQRRRARDAAQHFTAALKLQPNFRPALLNLATVLNRELNDPRAAAQRYREYLASQPRDADWQTVNALLLGLEQRLVGATRPPATNAPPVATPSPTNPPKPVIQVVAMTPPPRTNVPPVIPQPATAPATATVAPAKPAVAPAPVTRTEPSPSLVSNPVSTIPTASPTTNTAVAQPAEVKPEKRSFLARLNPFRRDAKPPVVVTALPPITNAIGVSPSAVPPAGPAAATPASATTRYTYLSPTTPAAGDRTSAEASLTRGKQARAANRLTEAAQAFQSAVDADAGSYEARYNLALTQYALRDYFHALASWEFALSLQPESVDARYGFALTLKAAGFTLDAVAELEKLVAAAPREARAHLVLGNLYAEQLQDKPRARVHYQRVLELDARHPQATQIRYWLVANPA